MEKVQWIFFLYAPKWNINLDKLSIYNTLITYNVMIIVFSLIALPNQNKVNPMIAKKWLFSTAIENA